MNFTKIFKSTLALSIFAATISCQDNIVLEGYDNEDPYVAAGEVYGYVKSYDTKGVEPVFELRQGEPLVAPIYFGLTHVADKIVDAELMVDNAKVDTFNAERNTSFVAMPEGAVAFDDNGVISIAPGDKQSYNINMTITPSDELIQGTTYLVPVVVKSVTEGVKLRDAAYNVLVKYMGNVPSTDKGRDFLIISCAEVNDSNPLNHIEYTLKNSGAMLFDMFIMFSANINYNEETGRVYLNCNENITAQLENHAHYIQPLRDRGIKVVLGLLGNHDRSGVANMAPATARAFAAELKTFADAYGLDGYFLDDEYSSYMNPVPPGFVSPSSDAAARLAYEIKRAMPDKLCTVYGWSYTRGFYNQVDGVNPGDFVDYAIADYGAGNGVGDYLGITKAQLCPYSQEYNLGRNIITDPTEIAEYREAGNGGHMVFAFDPVRDGFDNENQYRYNRYRSLEAIAEGAFDDELVWTGVIHPKDWK